MKKILIILTLFAGLAACENQENEFPDFDYTSGYFPYQYPVRTLVLGDYIYDNTNDNNHKFLISAAMGGVYENTRNREFDIEVDNNLCSKAFFGTTNDTIRVMPAKYYSLSSASKLTIPAGKVNGGIEVQLTDAFFDDPLAIKLGYVIPIRLLGSLDVDTILQGKTIRENPDPRVIADWDISPKNFTMFAVKYVNPYHGMYLHRGVDVVKDVSGTVVETNIYRTPYIVNNEIWSLVTTGKNQVSVNGNSHSMLIPGTLKMNLSFANDGTCQITQATDSPFPISGTGRFVKDGDEWGTKKRNSIILTYTCTAPYVQLPVEPTKVNDTDASIAYTGTWTTNAEVGNYKDDRHYSSTPGDFFTFKFTGVAVALYFKVGSYGTFDVFLDDMTTPIAKDVSAAAGAVAYQQKLFEKTGLTDGAHTVKCVIKQSKNVIFDYLTYTKAQTALPSGTYTHEVKDTLVVRDRDVTMETFVPVIQ